MIKILLAFLGIFCIWFGLTILEELYWRYLQRAKPLRIVIPIKTYFRLRENAKAFAIKPEEYVQENVAQFLLDLSKENYENLREEIAENGCDRSL